MATTTIELRSSSSNTLTRVETDHETEHETQHDLIEGSAPENAQSALLPVSKLQQFTVLMCGFFDVVLTIGINQAYGVFLSQYLDSPNHPDDYFLPPNQVQSKAFLAFIGTLAAGLTWSGSIVVNPIMARTKDLRWITFTGSCLIGVSYLLASFCNKAWQLLLTQGLMYGIGTSLLYFPVLAVAPEYFDSKRGAAMGFILSGAGIGGLTYAPLIRGLLSRIGTRWTLRTLGIVNFVVAMPVAYFTPQPRIRQRRPTLVNSRIARKATFILQAIAAMSQAAGNFVPLTFLPEFSTTLGYTAAFGATLLAINSGVNTISRIGMGFIADAAGRQNTLVISTIGSALTVVVFWLLSATSDDTGLWIAFVVTYGIFAGGYNSLFPTTVMEVFGRQAYASVNGFIYFIRGLGALWGSPVGGLLLGGNDYKPKAYITLIWYDFGLLMLSATCVTVVRFLDAREKKDWRLKA